MPFVPLCQRFCLLAKEQRGYMTSGGNKTVTQAETARFHTRSCAGATAEGTSGCLGITFPWASFNLGVLRDLGSRGGNCSAPKL